MKFVIKNRSENADGTIDCLVLFNDNWEHHIMDEESEYEIQDGDWPDIKPCPVEVKESYLTETARQDIVEQLHALDLPAYVLERALAGDQTALDKVATNELAKQELRSQL
jgi:hypothetical protein